jgi:hypothetical protein
MTDNERSDSSDVMGNPLEAVTYHTNSFHEVSFSLPGQMSNGANDSIMPHGLEYTICPHYLASKLCETFEA